MREGHSGRICSGKKYPYLGICYGLHAAVVDIARNKANLSRADTTENNSDTPHPVIGLVTEWTGQDGMKNERNKDSDMGGTMRMGAQSCHLEKDSKAFQIYKQQEIWERHRHRYEVNNNYIEILEDAGLKVAGRSADKSLVEVIEYKDHPWFVASQFHPEFTSSPRDGHPLFTSFIEAALICQTGK